MFGVKVSAVERRLFAVPLRLGGLGICNPVSLAFHLLNSSVHSSEYLDKSIIDFEIFELDSHFDCVSSNKLSYHQHLGVNFDEVFCQLLPLFDSKQQRAILRANDGKISAWLSVLL